MHTSTFQGTHTHNQHHHNPTTHPIPSFFSTPTLPDVPLVQIFTLSSVPTILTCERVCKQWSTVIRVTQTTQIWKQILLPHFPPGCVPEPFGRENWRDVALLWFAWKKPWTGWRVTEPRVMEAIEVDREVVRDLVAVPRFTLEGMQGLGVHVDGRALLDAKHCMYTGHLTKSGIINDAIFSDATALPFGRQIDDVDDGMVPFSRTKFIPRRSRKTPNNRIFENWQTGEVIGEVAVPKHRRYDYLHGFYVAVCGDKQIFTLCDATQQFGKMNVINLTRIVPSSERILPSFTIAHRSNDMQPIVHNENFLVYTTPTGPYTYGGQLPQVPGGLHLVRLDTGHRIASAPCWSPNPRLYLTSFNLFVASYRRPQTCDVYDLESLQYLYTITPPPDAWINVLPNDQITFSWNDEEYWVGDVFTRRFQPIVIPHPDVWVPVIEFSRQMWRDGYAVFTTEYPVHPDGVRTGERGRMGYFWRRLLCCPDAKEIGRKCEVCDPDGVQVVQERELRKSRTVWRSVIRRKVVSSKFMWKTVAFDGGSGVGAGGGGGGEGFVRRGDRRDRGGRGRRGGGRNESRRGGRVSGGFRLKFHGRRIGKFPDVAM
ncbi:hypothetical protein HDV00_002658 [Rhizophlyctis rosea]|nr:hypothetical protein HDV00_002658 [Rhizophlyctis rosea]